MKKLATLVSALVLSACTQQTTNDVQSFSLGNTDILLTSPHNMTHLTEKRDGPIYQFFKEYQQADTGNYYLASYMDFDIAKTDIFRYCLATTPVQAYYDSITPEIFEELKQLMSTPSFYKKPDVVKSVHKVLKKQAEQADIDGEFISVNLNNTEKIMESKQSLLTAFIKTEQYKENGQIAQNSEVVLAGLTLIKDKVIMLNCHSPIQDKQNIIDIANKWQKAVLRLNGY